MTMVANTTGSVRRMNGSASTSRLELLRGEAGGFPGEGGALGVGVGAVGRERVAVEGQAAVAGVADEEEAVAIANATPYGLASGIWSENIGRCLRLMRAINSGSFASEMLFVPRIRILVPEPRVPLVSWTATPGARPVRT